MRRVAQLIGNGIPADGFIDQKILVITIIHQHGKTAEAHESPADEGRTNSGTVSSLWLLLEDDVRCLDWHDASIDLRADPHAKESLHEPTLVYTGRMQVLGRHSPPEVEGLHSLVLRHVAGGALLMFSVPAVFCPPSRGASHSCFRRTRGKSCCAKA